MRARHSFIPILVMVAAACASTAPTTRPTSTTSSTSSTTTTLPPTTTTTAPPTTTTAAAPVARTSPPPPASRPAMGTQCPPEIVALIEKHWSRFGPEVVQWAIGIAWRESNCRPDVVSPTGCYSIFQMALPLHAPTFAAAGYPDWYSVRFNAEANIQAAALLYAGSGSSPWRL